MSDSSSNDDLKHAALEYHRRNPPGKIKVAPTKPLVTQRDLALAYSPGVAYACEAIVADPNAASGPMSPSPSTAVPLLITATRLPRAV